MARPTKAQQQDKRIAKVFGELKQIVSIDSQDRMSMREALFAQLVAEEGYNQSDAYRESFKPTLKATPESVNVMASRVANRPRVKAAIERLRSAETDTEISKADQSKLLANGDWLRNEVLNGLYSIATSDAPEGERLKAWIALGRSRQADVFVSGSTFVDASSKTVNMGLKPADNAGELRAQLVKAVSDMLRPSESMLLQSPQAIDIEVVNEDDRSRS